MLSARVSSEDQQNLSYPYLFCARLVHPDERVSGRRWLSEVGLRQETAGSPIECSVLVRTEEISARVTSPVQVTRPRFIVDLVSTCKPVGHTPGLSVKRLNEESADAFLREVERPDRRHPIVLVSGTADGHFAVEPERLRAVVIGLADVVEVSRDADTFAIERAVGRRYMAFGGAIKVVFAPRVAAGNAPCETAQLLWPELQDVAQAGSSVESAVLAAITHRTNLPYSWRHISLEVVAQAALGSQLQKALASARATADGEGYAELLEDAIDQLTAREAEIADLRQKLEDDADEAERLRSANEGLKHALSGRLAAESEPSDEAAGLVQPLRDALAAALTGDPALEQGLHLIQTMYPERVVVLESAYQAARDSDRRGFKFGEKGLELLNKLAREYWEALAGGKGDQQAKAVFGKNGFAAGEAETLTNEGRRRRTFTYLGRPLCMEKHLKYGVKDSSAETLRIHFEWVAEEKRIVIGHCGKHLDF